ncbi:hypothetical protein FBY06_10641 [Pseudomonas sp. SJZ085]|nr:hypothetical protein FBY06_10641 [Pseudomonas sp. SJZ085]
MSMPGVLKEILSWLWIMLQYARLIICINLILPLGCVWDVM